jgi:antitoxin component HigA of HigAB toxin-antitoxin module
MICRYRLWYPQSERFKAPAKTARSFYLIAGYEDEHVPIANVSEADVLRELMRSNGLSQMELAKAVGIAQSTVSAVLTGARSLTKGQILKLARFFGIAPAAFLPRDPHRGPKEAAARR